MDLHNISFIAFAKALRTLSGVEMSGYKSAFRLRSMPRNVLTALAVAIFLVLLIFWKNLGSFLASIKKLIIPAHYFLEKLLRAGKWQEADLETWELIKKITNREKQGYLKVEDYQNFPREQLIILDHLWLKYSCGRFGFSVQKQIWIDSGGTPGIYNEQVYHRFADRVGWRKDQRLLSYSDITFNDTAPIGHLPQFCVAKYAVSRRCSTIFGKFSIWSGGVGVYLFSLV